MTRFESVLDAVGGTPLVRLAKTGLAPRVYVKPEWYNPGGSVKDRAALSMLRAAEADGSLRPGGTVVEVTSGNTGIGLALYASVLGYRSVIYTSSNVSKEKRDLLVAYGAELRVVDAFVPKEHPDSLRSIAERFVAETPGAWLANQYDNPANPAAHVVSTGPEIWADSEGAVTHLVSTVGTGGTISGTARYLKRVSGGRVTVIGADPLTSTYSGGDGSSKAIEGAGHFVHPETAADAWPESLDVELIDRFEAVSDREAIDAIRALAVSEGLLAGGSSGVALVAGLRIAAELGPDDVVVILLPDSGRAYLSTYFNEDWLVANGFRAQPGPTVADFVSGPLRTVPAGASAGEALAGLGSAGEHEDAPVAVVHPRWGAAVAPHHSDVIGWVDRAVLRGAEPGSPVTALARKTAVRLGGGANAADAWAQASAADWDNALVLVDGRVHGFVSRAALQR